MAHWWNRGPLHAIKRGITSLFVCAVVLLPVFMTGMQLKNSFFKSDSRKTGTVAAMQVRALDKNTSVLKPFDEPLITVTFDDGWETVYTQALPLLQKYGIPTTQYVLSGVEQDQHYLSFDQIRSLQRSGHEIGCHTVDHKDLTSLDRQSLSDELTQCKTTIEKETGSKIREFASPYGASNPTTIAAIKDTYRSHRNTNGDIITNQADDQDINVRASFDPYQIIGVTLRGDTSVAQLQAAIDYTVAHNGWLVLNYHQVDDQTATGSQDVSKFSLTDKLLQDQLKAVSQSKARIVTTGQFMDAWQKESK